MPLARPLSREWPPRNFNMGWPGALGAFSPAPELARPCQAAPHARAGLERWRVPCPLPGSEPFSLLARRQGQG
eukprot:9010364-Pyramimonas_sp.AAC.1